MPSEEEEKRRAKQVAKEKILEQNPSSKVQVRRVQKQGNTIRVELEITENGKKTNITVEVEKQGNTFTVKRITETVGSLEHHHHHH
uniref:OR486 n=1 Tax=synthetic construct TaxID=32630 RepID=UPI0004F2371B|nr:Chain A, Or486 [synthetic construct]4R80_B Chain B, Or486 [synthetic construct]